jgi:uncharacterized membrane protein
MASVMFIIYLPILLLITAMVIDVGLLIVSRNKLQAAADFAALAGAQNLDLEALQDGVIVLSESSARADAIRWARENTFRNLHTTLDESNLHVYVRVYNASDNLSLFDNHTGRKLRDPTVCVVIEAVHQFHFIHGVFGEQRIKVHADASVLTKE